MVSQFVLQTMTLASAKREKPKTEWHRYILHYCLFLALFSQGSGLKTPFCQIFHFISCQGRPGGGPFRVRTPNGSLETDVLERD